MRTKYDTKYRGLARRIYIPYILTLIERVYFDIYIKHKNNPTIMYIEKNKGNNGTVKSIIIEATFTDPKIFNDVKIAFTNVEKVKELLT